MRTEKEHQHPSCACRRMRNKRVLPSGAQRLKSADTLQPLLKLRPGVRKDRLNGFEAKSEPKACQRLAELTHRNVNKSRSHVKGDNSTHAHPGQGKYGLQGVDFAIESAESDMWQCIRCFACIDEEENSCFDEEDRCIDWGQQYIRLTHGLCSKCWAKDDPIWINHREESIQHTDTARTLRAAAARMLWIWTLSNPFPDFADRTTLTMCVQGFWIIIGDDSSICSFRDDGESELQQFMDDEDDEENEKVAGALDFMDGLLLDRLCQENMAIFEESAQQKADLSLERLELEKFEQYCKILAAQEPAVDLEVMPARPVREMKRETVGCPDREEDNFADYELYKCGAVKLGRTKSKNRSPHRHC